MQEQYQPLRDLVDERHAAQHTNNVRLFRPVEKKKGRLAQVGITTCLYALAYLNYHIGHVAIPKNIPHANTLDNAKALIALEVYIFIGLVALMQLYFELKPIISKLKRSKLSNSKITRHTTNSLLSMGSLFGAIVLGVLTFTNSAEKQSGSMLAIAAGITTLIVLTYAVPAVAKWIKQQCCKNNDIQKETIVNQSPFNKTDLDCDKTEITSNQP